MENFSLSQHGVTIVFIQVTFFAVSALVCSLVFALVPDIEKRIDDFYDDFILPFFEFLSDAWNYKGDRLAVMYPKAPMSAPYLRHNELFGIDLARFKRDCRRKKHLSGITSVQEANNVGTKSAYNEEWDGA